MKIKKVWSLVLTAVIFSISLFTACSCNHEWKEATCTEPKTCSLCNATEGEALGHEWKDATCTEPKTCERCGETDGEALGHSWKDATCTEPKTCTVCGETEGGVLYHDAKVTCTEGGTCSRCGEKVPAAGHKWEEATCTEPKTCSVCGAKEGKALGHTTTRGTCSRCGLELFEPIVKSGSGDAAVTDVELGDDGIFVAHFKHTGRSNFIVHGYPESGSRELLVNEIGNYDGTVLLGDSGSYMFNISADGNWECTIDKLGTTLENSFSGKGDTVTPIFMDSSLIWTFKHDGSSNFAVRLYTAEGTDLLVNEIGPYNGEQIAVIPSGGAAFFEVMADGNWSIAPKE